MPLWAWTYLDAQKSQMAGFVKPLKPICAEMVRFAPLAAPTVMTERYAQNTAHDEDRLAPTTN